MTIPVPHQSELNSLTEIVDGFGFVPSQADRHTMSFLHNHIKHVMYIIKENRTYDQILGACPSATAIPRSRSSGSQLLLTFIPSPPISWTWTTSIAAAKRVWTAGSGRPRAAL
jgi:phospholipase C